MILAELRHIEDYDDIYGKSKTYDIETFKIDGEGYFFGKFWWRVFFNFGDRWMFSIGKKIILGS